MIVKTVGLTTRTTFWKSFDELIKFAKLRGWSYDMVNQDFGGYKALKIDKGYEIAYYSIEG